MPRNRVINELVIDNDDKDIEDFVEQYRGLTAAELFERHRPRGLTDPVTICGCRAATSWHFEPWQAGEPLVMVIETLNARPIRWFEFALGYELRLPSVEMRSRCPEGGFAGYARIAGQVLTTDKLVETEARSAESFFDQCVREADFASSHGY